MKKLLSILLLLVLAAANTTALDAIATDGVFTGMSGTWKLNLQKSILGKEKETPREVIAEIRYARPAFEVKVTKKLRAGDDVANYRYFTDGKPATNTAEGMAWKTQSLRSTAREMLLDQTSRYMLFTIAVSDRWSLSEDGRQLTIERTVQSIPRNEKIKYVFERQS